MSTRVVYKYPLQVAEVQEVDMPAGAEILAIQTQFERPCVWALVDSSLPMEKRMFEMYGTGQEYRDTFLVRKYLGSFQLQGGALIVHCFEVKIKI